MNSPRETLPLARARVSEVRLVLPYPVSANRYWQSFVPRGMTRAIVVVSKEAKDYKRTVGRLARDAGLEDPTDQPLELDFTLCPRMNKDGSASAVLLDLGNALKVAEDAMQGSVYVNDKQVKRLRMAYGPQVQDGALIVEIRPFAGEAEPEQVPLELVTAGDDRDPF